MNKHELVRFLEPFTDDVRFEVIVDGQVLDVTGISYSCDNGRGVLRFSSTKKTRGSPRLCPGCRSLDGEHDFGPTCTLGEGLSDEE